MDQFSTVRAVVTMLTNYLRLPEEERQGRPGSGQARRAWELVSKSMRQADPKAAHLLKLYREDPTTYEEGLFQSLVRQAYVNPSLAGQLDEIVSQFYQERAAEGPRNIAIQGRAGGSTIITGDGNVVGDGSLVILGGDFAD